MPYFFSVVDRLQQCGSLNLWGPAWLSGKVLDSTLDPLGFCVGVSLAKTLQSPSLVLVKPRKDMNNVNCRRDMTEIPLKVA